MNWKTKWCEKCSVEYISKYTVEEIHGDDTLIPMEYELKKCPQCGKKLETFDRGGCNVQRSN